MARPRRYPTDGILCVTPLQVWRPRSITRRGREEVTDNSHNMVFDEFGNENSAPRLAGDESDENWDAILKGYNVHSIHNYSDFTYQEVDLAVKTGKLTRKQALAVLMNADLYLHHQEYYKSQDPFLIDNDYFQKSSKWKNVNILLQKHKFDGRFQMLEYRDEKDGLRRFTLIMCNAEEENKYHLVESRQNGKKKGTKKKTIEVSEDEDETATSKDQTKTATSKDQTKTATSKDQGGEEVPKDQTSENQSVLNQTDAMPLELQAERVIKRKRSDAREDTDVKKKNKKK